MVSKWATLSVRPSLVCGHMAFYCCPLIVTRPDPISRSHSLLQFFFVSSDQELEHSVTRQHSTELQRAGEKYFQTHRNEQSSTLNSSFSFFKFSSVSLPRPLCSSSPAASFSSVSADLLSIGLRYILISSSFLCFLIVFGSVSN